MSSRERRTSKLAVASVLLALVSLALLIFFLKDVCRSSAVLGIVVAASAAAVLVGIVALFRIAGTYGRPVGRAAAWFGTVLGAVLFIVVGVGMLLPTLAVERAEAKDVRCGSNLLAIAKGSQLWLNKSGNQANYPPSLKTLLEDGYCPDPRIFLCSERGARLKPGTFICDYESVFDRADFTITEAMASLELPLAWDKRGNHDGGINVVYFDAHVEFHRGDDAYDRIIKQVDDWIAKHRPPSRKELRAPVP